MKWDNQLRKDDTKFIAKTEPTKRRIEKWSKIT